MVEPFEDANGVSSEDGTTGAFGGRASFAALDGPAGVKPVTPFNGSLVVSGVCDPCLGVTEGAFVAAPAAPATLSPPGTLLSRAAAFARVLSSAANIPLRADALSSRGVVREAAAPGTVGARPADLAVTVGRVDVGVRVGALALEDVTGEALTDGAFAFDALGETLTGETLTGETLTGETLTGETLTGETLTGETLTGEAFAFVVLEGATGETFTGGAFAFDILGGDTLAVEGLALEVFTMVLEPPPLAGCAVFAIRSGFAADDGFAGVFAVSLAVAADFAVFFGDADTAGFDVARPAIGGAGLDPGSPFVEVFAGAAGVFAFVATFVPFFQAGTVKPFNNLTSLRLRPGSFPRKTGSTQSKDRGRYHRCDS